MNVILEAIKPQSDSAYQVTVLLNSEQHHFTLTVNQAGALQVVTGAPDFLRRFANDSHLALEIEKLVGRYHNGSVVEFPIQVSSVETDPSAELIELETRWHQRRKASPEIARNIHN